MPYQSTKTYGHNLGLSVAFRQHKAESHCRFIHGYALQIKLTFEADQLDENGWVMDFGGLKAVKRELEARFDHTLLVAVDDPQRELLQRLHVVGISDVRLVDATGCEAFSRQIYQFVQQWLKANGHTPRVHLASVEVFEHGANSAAVYAHA